MCSDAEQADASHLARSDAVRFVLSAPQTSCSILRSWGFSMLHCACGVARWRVHRAFVFKASGTVRAFSCGKWSVCVGIIGAVRGEWRGDE